MPNPVQVGIEVHERWMQQCLTLAARGAGHASPNPMVGAVLVAPGETVLGVGWHEAYGQPHAEPNAINAALEAYGAEAVRTATLYVNLEPCSHHGKTPPCADYILKHGIPRVVVGMTDPFSKVAGRGIQRLHDRGIEVITGVLEKQCRRFNEAFVHHVKTGRPLVTLKMAQTLDGHLATTTGDSRWVSGLEARTLVHQWRSELDGVLVGHGTAQTDDPALTVRHVEGRQPVRMVLDREGILSPSLQLFTDADAAQTVAVVGPYVRPAYTYPLQRAGGRVWQVPERDGHLDLEVLLDRLGKEGGVENRPMQSLLVEAGPGLATALFKQGLVDRFFLFVAPKLIGAGVPTLHTLGIERMADAHTFAEHGWEMCGKDLLFRGYRHTV